MDFGLGLPDTTMDSYMNKAEGVRFRSTQSPSRPFYPAPARSQKPPMSREKPARKGKLGYETEKKVPKDCNYKWQLEGLYEKFGKCLEYDVAFTITNDLQRLKDAHKMEQLQGENQRHVDEQNKYRNQHRRKIKDMLNLYYEHKINDECKILYDRDAKQFAHSRKKSRDVNPLATHVVKGVKSNLIDNKPSVASLSKDKRGPSASRESLSVSRSKEALPTQKRVQSGKREPADKPKEVNKAQKLKEKQDAEAELRRKYPDLYDDGASDSDAVSDSKGISISRSKDYEGGMKERAASASVRVVPGKVALLKPAATDYAAWFKKKDPQQYDAKMRN